MEEQSIEEQSTREGDPQEEQDATDESQDVTFQEYVTTVLIAFLRKAAGATLLLLAVWCVLMAIAWKPWFMWKLEWKPELIYKAMLLVAAYLVGSKGLALFGGTKESEDAEEETEEEQDKTGKKSQKNRGKGGGKRKG